MFLSLNQKSYKIVKQSTFLLYLFLGIFLLFVQSQHPVKITAIFEHSSIHFSYIFLVIVNCLSPHSLLTLSFLNIAVASIADLLSDFYYGFYVLSFYISLIPILVVRNYFTKTSLPMIIIVTIIASFIKGFLEFIMLGIFINPQAMFVYLKQHFIAEIILNALFTPIFYFIFKSPQFLKKMFYKIIQKIFKKR